MVQEVYIYIYIDITFYPYNEDVVVTLVILWGVAHVCQNQCIDDGFHALFECHAILRERHLYFIRIYETTKCLQTYSVL